MRAWCGEWVVAFCTHRDVDVWVLERVEQCQQRRGGAGEVRDGAGEYQHLLLAEQRGDSGNNVGWLQACQ